ncbi:MAG: hypothetical protein WBN42_09260 [Ignavibacteriaceae bacterium]
MSEINIKSEITITEKAKKEILRIMKENNVPGNYGLRVGVKGG